MANASIKSKDTKSALRKLQDEDFDWFLANYQELYNTYGNVFLAIKNKKVLGSYTSYAEAVRETQLHEALGSFIVQECTDSPNGFTNYVASVGLTVI